MTDIYFNGYNAHRVFQLSVPPDADNWYINGVESRRRYLADLGIQVIEGGFFAILRSNIVETPPSRESFMREPFIKFAPLHESAVGKTGTPWHEQFTGYTLVERKGEKEHG